MHTVALAGTDGALDWPYVRTAPEFADAADMSRAGCIPDTEGWLKRKADVPGQRTGFGARCLCCVARNSARDFPVCF